MSQEFQYSQRPFAKSFTDEEYDRATGRLAASPPNHPPQSPPPLAVFHAALLRT